MIGFNFTIELSATVHTLLASRLLFLDKKKRIDEAIAEEKRKAAEAAAEEKRKAASSSSSSTLTSFSLFRRYSQQ